MSNAANWSYTSTATHWPSMGRDDWTGTLRFGAPVSFACDYSAKAERMTDQKGVEFVSRQIIYTERATINRGDFVMIGASTAADPIAAGAFEVRSVTRFSDTFEKLADDYMVAT